jgi:hypothetical protein
VCVPLYASQGFFVAASGPVPATDSDASAGVADEASVTLFSESEHATTKTPISASSTKIMFRDRMLKIIVAFLLSFAGHAG